MPQASNPAATPNTMEFNFDNNSNYSFLVRNCAGEIVRIRATAHGERTRPANLLERCMYRAGEIAEHQEFVVPFLIAVLAVGLCVVKFFAR